jgi:hypothetical protein
MMFDTDKPENKPQRRKGRKDKIILKVSNQGVDRLFRSAQPDVHSSTENENGAA